VVSFDTLGHDWLEKFVAHRIADRRMLRLNQKWLRAGVLEDGKRIRGEEGAVQGGSMTPWTQKITSSSWPAWSTGGARKPLDMCLNRL